MIHKNKLLNLTSLTGALAIIATAAYLGAPGVFAHDEVGLKPHHIDVPMNPTAVMRAFQESKAGQIESVEPAQAAALTACSSGTAGGYPCSNIDLQAFMPRADFGATASNDELNDIWGWTDPSNGKEYALVGHVFGTAVVDITVPDSPVHVADLELHGSFGSSWRDIKVYKNHAFVVSEASGYGMQVFDLSELRNLTNPPETLFELAHYAEFGSAHNIVINEESGFAYAVGAKNANGTQRKCSGGLAMVNIQDPANPTDAGCFSSDGYTHDAQCVIYRGPDLDHEGREICFASNEDTLTIVDVTDKTAPVQLSKMSYGGSEYTHQGWLTPDQAFFVLDDELDESRNLHNTRTRMFDVADLDAPDDNPVAVYDSSASAIDHNQYVRGRFVFQANYRAGLRILEIEAGVSPALSEAAFFDVYPGSDAAQFNGAWSNYPYFASGNVVVSHIEQGLFVLKPNVDRVSFGSPLYHGVELSGSVDVQVIGVDAQGGAAPIVGWELDGADMGGPGTWQTADASDGLHRLTSWMLDAQDDETSSTILVTINNGGSEPNNAPVAVLSAPPPSVVGQEIVLDGTGSYDDDNDDLSYSWALIDRPKGKDKSGFADSGADTTSMTPEKAGTYQVRLTVSDGIASDAVDATFEVTDSGTGGGGPKPCRGGPKQCP
jgi:choice-of-anchor B domain-containing protein